MPDQNGGTTALAQTQMTWDRGDPQFDVGMVPSPLGYAPEHRRHALPQALPMFRTAVLETRHHTKSK